MRCAEATEDDLLEKLRELSRTLPGAEEYVMVHHPAFRVRKKPYVVVGLRRQDKAVFSVNLGRMEQADLLEDERFHKTRQISACQCPGRYPRLRNRRTRRSSR
jgi:hypothetical protein